MNDNVVALVRDALAHLYNYPYLQQHALADQLGLDASATPRERMRLLRSALINGIDELKPRSDATLRSARSRSYQVLNLHYVESMLVDEVARDLAISPRQIYRDLRKAEEDLAAILGLVALRQDPDSSDADSGGDALGDELAHIAASAMPQPLGVILAEAQQAVAALATARKVTLTLDCPEGISNLRCQRGELVRQALVSLFSNVIRLATPGTVTPLVVRDDPEQPGARLQLGLVTSASPNELALVTPRHLLVLADGGLEVAHDGDQITLQISLAVEQKRRILVVDDNEGLLNLFDRFFDNTSFAMLAALNADEGFELARSHQPAAIILDVMMPGRDGWSLLQRLNNDPATDSIPTIVCSVIKDPELATSLGATAYLTKPVTRQELLQTLNASLRDGPPSGA